MKKPIKDEIIVKGRPYVFVKEYPDYLLYRDKYINSIRTCISWFDTGLIPVGHESKEIKQRDTENYGQDRKRKRWFV